MSFPQFLLLLPILLLTACTSLETKEETDDMGFRSVWTEDTKTGERHGQFRLYKPNGDLTEEANYEQGKLNGPRKVFYPNGKIQVIENYYLDDYIGEYVTYDTSGRVTLEGTYVNGAMAKAWTQYYPDGKVKEVVTYKDNKENGPFREWYPDGKPKASGNYINGGKEHGVLHVFRPDGTLERVMNCDRGACMTFWTIDSSGVAPAVPDMTPPVAASK